MFRDFFCKKVTRYDIPLLPEQGTGEDVPIYLRCEEGMKIRDRTMSKDDALALIREIWMEKSRQEAEVRERSLVD